MNIKLIQGDALEVLPRLPDESVDLVVTDPPYNSSISWDRKNDEWQLKWLKEVKRIMKEGASLYVFFAPLNMFEVEKFIRENFTLKNLCVWYHKNLYSVKFYGKDKWKLSWDVVFYAVKGKKAKHNINISAQAYLKYGRGVDVFEYPQPRPLLHKAQKPLKLIRKLIDVSSEKGDLVLDPFLGSGTTMKACLELGRNCIGIEKDPKTVNLIKKNLHWGRTLIDVNFEFEKI